MVPLAATPDTGYSLSAWTGACTGTGACAPLMTAAEDGRRHLRDPAAHADRHLARPRTITGTGIICGTGDVDCTETYDYGTVVPLTATADTGSDFGGWTGACSGTGACSVTMTAARTVGATFTVRRYTLTVTTPTHGTITGTGIICGTGGSDCTETYDYGTVVPLAPNPDPGYRLRTWTGACTGFGACSLTMTAARTVGGALLVGLPAAEGRPESLHRPRAHPQRTGGAEWCDSGGRHRPRAAPRTRASVRARAEARADTGDQVRARDEDRDEDRDEAWARAKGRGVVPDVPRVVVSGEVRNPGAYAWFPGMTVRQLIAVARQRN